MISRLKQKYSRLPSKDKTQIIILIMCVVVSGYGFWAASVWQQMFEAEKLANRKANRIETRIGKIEEPKFDRNISESNLKKLTEKLKESQQEISKLTSKFVSINDAEKLQSLKLNISELADDVKLNIQDFQVVGLLTAPEEEELAEYNDRRKQFYKRPHFSLKAEGDFYSLLTFIQALNQLEYFAIVQQLNVEYLGSGKLDISLKIMV